MVEGDRAIARVAPGGVVVIKEADQVPVWKSRLATGQELLATKVLRITEGDQVAPGDRLMLIASPSLTLVSRLSRPFWARARYL